MSEKTSVPNAKCRIPEMVLTDASERRKYVSRRSGLRTQFNLRDTIEMSEYQWLGGRWEGEVGGRGGVRRGGWEGRGRNKKKLSIGSHHVE